MKQKERERQRKEKEERKEENKEERKEEEANKYNFSRCISWINLKIITVFPVKRFIYRVSTNPVHPTYMPTFSLYIHWENRKFRWFWSKDQSKQSIPVSLFSLLLQLELCRAQLSSISISELEYLPYMCLPRYYHIQELRMNIMTSHEYLFQNKAMLAFSLKKKESYTHKKKSSFILDNCTTWGISGVFPKWEVPQHCVNEIHSCLRRFFMVEHHSEAYLTLVGLSIQTVRTNGLYGYIYNIYIEKHSTLYMIFYFEYLNGTTG